MTAAKADALCGNRTLGIPTGRRGRRGGVTGVTGGGWAAKNAARRASLTDTSLRTQTLCREDWEYVLGAPCGSEQK